MVLLQAIWRGIKKLPDFRRWRGGRGIFRRSPMGGCSCGMAPRWWRTGFQDNETFTGFCEHRIAAGGWADLRVFDGQGRELRDARVEEISATEVRVTAQGYAPVTVAKGATAVTLSRITVLATPGLAEEVMVRPEMILTGDWLMDTTVAQTLDTQPNVALQQTGPGAGVAVFARPDGLPGIESGGRRALQQFHFSLRANQIGVSGAKPGLARGSDVGAGTQYGSDGLGGTIQVLTDQPRFDASPAWHGDLSRSWAKRRTFRLGPRRRFRAGRIRFGFRWAPPGGGITTSGRGRGSIRTTC